MENSTPLELVATAAFGLEAVVVRELGDLGYTAQVMRPGRIRFEADASAICRSNLWLRSADRVLLQLAKFEALDFDALFDTVREIPWESWIAPTAAIPVRGKAVKSQLSSVPACQRTVKKAIVERLTSDQGWANLPETGHPVPVEVNIFNDEATISIDTSGQGLHRRGYRTLVGPAQIRETLAAGLVQLSFWNPDRPLIDPFCGTGTLAIEAALLGRRIAPGTLRQFAAEHWPAMTASQWETARQEARDLALPSIPERIIATDTDSESLQLARYHAEQASVAGDIHFQQQNFLNLSSQRQYGCLICNPPYGERLGDDKEITALYQSIPKVLRKLKTWSHFMLSARDDLENLVGQQADRRRKLYNGRIACTYYQFFGPRPPRPANENRVKPPACSEQAFGGLHPEAERQATEFANRLRKRARHLRRWPSRQGITCFRLYERDIPEIPLVVDLYEEALHIAEFERPHERTAAEHADWLDQMVQTAAHTLQIPREFVFVKHRAPQRGHSQYNRLGDEQTTRVVQEGGLKFQVNLSDYLDTGLFLDHRITRSLVRKEAQGTNFLNLFAYTGTFSVYAAAGGATQTTSVDLSPTYLSWASENLRLNDFKGKEHRQIQSDVMRYLGTLSPDRLFDLVVVDPPTYSNSKKLNADWDIQRDYVTLLKRVLLHTAEGGVIFFSTNSRRFKLDEDNFHGVVIRNITRQTIPEDFRNRRIHQCWRIIKTGT